MQETLPKVDPAQSQVNANRGNAFTPLFKYDNCTRLSVAFVCRYHQDPTFSEFHSQAPLVPACDNPTHPRLVLERFLAGIVRAPKLIACLLYHPCWVIRPKESNFRPSAEMVFLGLRPPRHDFEVFTVKMVQRNRIISPVA